MRTVIVRSLVASLMSFRSRVVAVAQQSAPPVPQVVTVGRGEVELKPDRAHVQFSVETRGRFPGVRRCREWPLATRRA